MEKKWWHDAIVYQIYPKSFMDTNGDGIGDLQGIISKLDYLSELGINTLWLCPIFASPMVDNGYDISDYKAIHESFGTMTDFDELICETKKRNIRVLLDLVLNHTSDQHIWFQEAILSPDNPYRNYYIIRKGKDGDPPNNWRSNFGGSAWEKLGDTDEYYLHTFAPQQPDLNWENPCMRKDLYEMICWWIDKGVAGFRIDAICFIKKNQNFPNLPPDGYDGLANPADCWLASPGIEVFLSEMRDEVFAPQDIFTVAEANGVGSELLGKFIGKNGFFSTIFDFSYTDIDIKSGDWYDQSNFTRPQLRDTIFASQKEICKTGHGAPYLENHDQNRSPNKYLMPEEISFVSKTMLGVLYFFLQGIPFIYQGQELGMENHSWTSLEDFNDAAVAGQYQKAVSAGLSNDEAFAIVAHRARDNSRTPMLWDDNPSAGFTVGKPWLPVFPDYTTLNAASQDKHNDSVLWFYRKMIDLRRKHSDLFFDGKMIPCFEDHAQLFAYERRLDNNCALIVSNFNNKETCINLPEGTLMLGNIREKGTHIKGVCLLAPFEAMVIKLFV